MKRLKLLLLLPVVLLTFASCKKEAEAPLKEGRTVIRYWEKWTNFEADAMQVVVDKYNQSQEKIYVEYLTTSQINNKLLLATAGGHPPDVAGFWANQVAVYVEKGSLMALDELMERDGIKREDYLPGIANLCEYDGEFWGLPTTPATLALHYNKTLFEKAGLTRPPRTIKELDEYAEKLTLRDEKGKITQLGFMPPDPGWWNALWSFYFGGYLFDKDGNLTCQSPEVIESLEWVKSYPDKYGLKDLQKMRDSAGGFDSAQNLFIGEKLAMQIQGVWMGNFIDKYNPDMDWAVAPFPVANEGLENTTVIEADLLVIPRSCEHIEEAWDFIKFVQAQENMELLNMGQRKFSPLKKVSDEFYAEHPNPYIKIFRALAESPNVRLRPKQSILSEYEAELSAAFDEVWNQIKTPQEAMDTVYRRIQPRLEKKKKILALRNKRKMAKSSE